MDAIVPVSAVLILLILATGVGFAFRNNRSRQRHIAQLTGHLQQYGWRRVQPDLRVGTRTWLLYQALGSAVFNVQVQFEGEHRGVRFHATQVARPPSPRRVTFQRLAVVYISRPVPGPRVQIAKRGLSSATFLTASTPIDNGPFDAAFHVSTEDPALARAVLHPGLAAALLQDARAYDSVVALEQQELFAVQHGQLTPQNLLAMLDLLIDIHGSVPWGQFGAPAAHQH